MDINFLHFSCLNMENKNGSKQQIIIIMFIFTKTVKILLHQGAHDQTNFFNEYPKLSTYPVAFLASLTPMTSLSSTAGALSSSR